MERLTIAERALLANVRQMEHYRRGFYLSVVTGEQPGQGPNRRGGFFGGSGLEGFSGVGGGGFGQVGQFFGGGFGGQQIGFTGGAGAQQAGGYMGLLQTAQVIRNQYSNIAGLADSVEQLQAAHDAGRIDRFQVDLARQALYNAQSQLLISQAAYERTLDDFKFQHGLPPDLPVKIADPMLDRFNLLDPELAELQIRVTDILTVLREGPEAAEPGGPGQPLVLPTEPPPEGETEAVPTDFNTLVQLAAELNAAAEQRLAAAQNDYRQLLAALPKRQVTLQRLAERDDAREAEMDPALLSIEQLNARVAQLGQELDTLSQRIGAARAVLERLTTNVNLPPLEHRAQLTAALTLLSGELLELSLLQARARLDAITFDPVELTPEEGYCIASRYRRDWMNARAALVDSWRLIHFNANDLESDLDLIFSGDIGNVNDNPFSLSARDARLSVGLQFDAPLTRLSERNTYRQSLIEFQQARRTYYQFRDRIQRDVRATLRQLQLDDLNFELRRAAVHVAITQVDLARLRLSEPSRPVTPTAPGQPLQPGGQAQFGATVARDLVNALIDLLNVQNDFLSVWVDQEVQRLQLDFELGIMELDENGLRIEHEQPLKSFLASLPNSAPFELPSPCEGVAPEPCAPVSVESESDTGEPLPEPQQLEIPPAMGATSEGAPTAVRRLPRPEAGASAAAAGSGQEAMPVLLDYQG
jgi:hypothetical protein